jgi:hypothetical protein
MAKWSLRIEMQAMDIGEHCPFDGKIHSTGEIFDGFDSFIYSKWSEFGVYFEARTIDQEETPPFALPSQRCPIPYQIPSQRCVDLRKGAAYTGELVGKRSFILGMSQTSRENSGSVEGVGGEWLLFKGIH